MGILWELYKKASDISKEPCDKTDAEKDNPILSLEKDMSTHKAHISKQKGGEQS